MSGTLQRGITLDYLPILDRHWTDNGPILDRPHLVEMLYIATRCNIGVKSEASRGKHESNNVQS